jgi:ferritin-like protein
MGWHEDERTLSPRTKDLHRAIVSLQEELEAIDWYQQRVDATQDPDLRRVLQHNRDEEVEHAMMVLEWIRRHDIVFARKMKEHTNHLGPIVTPAETAEVSGAAEPKEAVEPEEKGRREGAGR